MNSFVGGLAGALGLPGLEEGVDDLEDGALVGVGERFDLLQPVSVIAPTASPVPVTAGDVATGWLRHSGDLKSLRHWARFVHGSSNLIELQFDEHALGEKLLEALWQVAFHEPVTQEMHDLARRVLFQA